MKVINGATFSKMVVSASRLLELNREQIDALNVFPVPDGDTGTNMYYTLKTCVSELYKSPSNTLSDIADSVSIGVLKGARGNSGVISSQVFRGLCSVLKEVTECDIKTFTKAMKNATDVAYSAVSKPQEGTMLTVCRMMYEAALQSKAREFEDYFKDIITGGENAVNLTPELLPVLKKAGVVDSGGLGLLTIFKGMYKSLIGEEIVGVEPEVVVSEEDKALEHADILNLGTIEFGYCTEFFIINVKKKTTLASIDSLREYLMTIGDCVLVVGDLNFIKVHVHTNNPGMALSKALQLGELDKVKIDNLLEQNRELIKKYKAEEKPMGMLAICSGEGLTEIFKDIGVDQVIEGGQTMNPSAQDIANAICKINATNIFVFPNNKNIILAAEQSKQLVEGKNIHVIPTKNIPQGITAALTYNPDDEADVNKTNMIHSLDNVVAGQVTHAIRTTDVDGISLKKGDIIGLNDKKILVKNTNVADCVVDLVKSLKTSDHAVLNIYYGQDLTENDAGMLQTKCVEAFPELDVELFQGGQPVYYALISLE